MQAYAKNEELLPPNPPTVSTQAANKVTDLVTEGGQATSQPASVYLTYEDLKPTMPPAVHEPLAFKFVPLDSKGSQIAKPESYMYLVPALIAFKKGLSKSEHPDLAKLTWAEHLIERLNQGNLKKSDVEKIRLTFVKYLQDLDKKPPSGLLEHSEEYPLDF